MNNTEIELSEERAIVSIPKNTVGINMSCQVYDEDKDEIFKCSKKMGISDVRDAVCKAANGYYEENDCAKPDDDGDTLAMIHFPENVVTAQLSFLVYNDETGEVETIERKYGMQKIYQMLKYAENGYIDDDDTFVLSDKAKALMADIQGGCDEIQ